MIAAKVWVPVVAVSSLGVWSLVEIFRYGNDEIAIFLDDDMLVKEVEDTGKSYLEFFQSKNIGVVNAGTNNFILSNILRGRMFPHYRKNHTYTRNQLFKGSPYFTLKGRVHRKNGRELFIIDKNPTSDEEKLRRACKDALEKPMDKSGNDPEIYRLREWCTFSTVKDVLRRHKFRFPSKDSQWKQILQSDWITNPTLLSKQDFFDENTVDTLKGEYSEQEKIAAIKRKCTISFATAFKRNTFPATKDFLGTKAKIDDFQEAALFCTIPKTAEDYVIEAMQGTINTSIGDDMKRDYCYIQGKDIEFYKKIKTTDAMQGKSFWCAVRMLYHKHRDNRTI